MDPKAASLTPEQEQEKLRAESENLRSMQDTLASRTRYFSRIRSPRISIVTGKSSAAVPLVS